MKYIITEEIESPNKIAKNIEVFDFFFVLCYAAISVAISSIVSEKLFIPFFVFSVSMAVFLTVKSPFNRNRRNYESIYFMLTSDKEVYNPIYDYVPEDENEKEK